MSARRQRGQREQQVRPPIEASLTEHPPYGPEQQPWDDSISGMATNAEGQLLISPPVRDPLVTYADVNKHVTGKYYQVPSTGLSKEQQDTAQGESIDVLQTAHKTAIGYQTNNYMPQYREPISPYLEFMSNNIGDPYEAGSFVMNTKWMECNVLDYYASLWNARWPYKFEDPESYWGYVLTMGSTEGNLYAAWNARDYLGGKYLYYEPSFLLRALAKSAKGNIRELPTAVGFAFAQAKLKQTAEEDNPNAFSPVVFYSEDTHYSNIKATQTIDIPPFHAVGEAMYPGQCPIADDWPTEVPSEGGSLGPGTIDVEALCKLVEFFAQNGHPIYVVLNYGSTFKGVYDHVEEITTRLEPILRDNGMFERDIELEDGSTETRAGFWIHVDGALGASYMPFVKMAAENNIVPGLEAGPKFDFSIPMVSSIVTSAHKWPGCPWPAGVFMTRNKYRIQPPSGTPTYVGAPDTTFAGSRNATTAAILWTYISTHSYEKQVEKIIHCLNVINYAYAKLKKLETELGKDLWVTHSDPASLSLYLKKPNETISYKYSLSTEDLLVNGGEQRTYAHIYFMENVTYTLVNELVEELRAPDAFPDQNPTDKAAQMLSWARKLKSRNTTKPTPLRHVPIFGRGWK